MLYPTNKEKKYQQFWPSIPSRIIRLSNFPLEYSSFLKPEASSRRSAKSVCSSPPLQVFSGVPSCACRNSYMVSCCAPVCPLRHVGTPSRYPSRRAPSSPLPIIHSRRCRNSYMHYYCYEPVPFIYVGAPTQYLYFLHFL